VETCAGLLLCVVGRCSVAVMSGREDSVIVVGIDEAGYGPLLGPLVVSAVVFRVRRALIDGDWWVPLREVVARKPRVRERRLVVVDSKVLSSRADGLRWLERGVLAFVGSADDASGQRRLPATVRQMVGRLNGDIAKTMQAYAWYAGDDPALPLAVTPEEIRIDRSALGTCLADAGITFVGAAAEILLEEHFNRLVGATRNKSVVLLGQTIRLVQRCARVAGQADLHVYIDKQGARNSYGRALMTAFDDAHLEILEESDTHSAYRLVRRPAPWTVRFIEKGETHHLPIALASMFSKYQREIMMHIFNAYWQAQIPGLRRTAGYYRDGQRFVRDIAGRMEHLGIEPHTLIRSR
jgi:ribonuclease HII